MHLLVCFALKEEAAPFRKIAAGKSAISILVTGMGHRNATRAVGDFLRQNSPQQVFTSGFAGGLNPDLKLGEVVFETPEPKSAIPERLLAAGAKPVEFFCVDRIAISGPEKRKLRADTAADAVEMESGVIHAICRERGIPCATVRVILDTANEDLPLDFNALFNADLSLNYRKLAWAIAKSPGKVGSFLRFRKRCRFAASQLAVVLSHVL
jgi:adenosylhomocysteine nucleosidase